MELFGAPFWFRGAVLFKIALIDSLIAVFISMSAIYFITNSALFYSILKDLNISLNINYLKEMAILLGISLGISIISSVIVVLTQERK